MRRMSLDSVIFGSGGKNKVVTIDKALDQEMGRLEKETDQLSAMKPKKPHTPHTLEPVAEVPEEEAEEKEESHPSQSSGGHDAEQLVPRSARRAGSLNVPPPIKAESIMSSLHEEPLFKEMMENAGVNLEKEEEEAHQRRLQYEQDVLARQQELLRKGTEAELKAYVESAAVSNPNSIVNRRPLNPFATIKPFADTDGVPRTRSRSRSGSQSEARSVSSSSDDNMDLENVGKFDENELKSSASNKRPSRANDFIDHLGDMRKINNSHDDAPSGAPTVPVPQTRRTSILDTLGDMRKAHTPLQLADELGSSVHGTRRASALANPRLDEPMPPPMSSDTLVPGGIASLSAAASVGASAAPASSAPAAPAPKLPLTSISNLFASVGGSSSGTSSSSTGYTTLKNHDVEEDLEKGGGRGTPSPALGGANAVDASNKNRPRKESGASIAPSVSSTNLTSIATLNPLLGSNLLSEEQREKMAEMTRVSLMRAKTVSKEGLNQTVVATQ